MFILCQMEIFVSEGTKLSYFFFPPKLIFKTAAHILVCIYAQFKYISKL